MSFLGSSPVTSIMGYIVMLVTVVQATLTENGTPHDTQSWLQFVGQLIVGIALRFSKDANVSNSPVPTSEAKSVS